MDREQAVAALREVGEWLLREVHKPAEETEVVAIAVEARQRVEMILLEFCEPEPFQ